MADREKMREKSDFGDGFAHSFKPLHPLNLSQVTDFETMLVQMSETAFGARNLGEALEVCTTMLRDPECIIVGIFSGAMIMAKRGLVLCEMIDRNFLDVIISAGALVMHGLIKEVGACHFKYDGEMRDAELYEYGYNRVYDTIETEKNLNHTSSIIDNIWEKFDSDSPLSSSSLLAKIGEHLSRNENERGILKSAFEGRYQFIFLLLQTASLA
jgi:deoxyhypusine synthase